MKFSSILTLFTLGALTRVDAAAVQAPLKARFSADVIRRAVQKRDQEVLRVFQDKSLQPVTITLTDDDTHKEKEETQDYSNSKFTELTASIVPKEGEVADFDFDINMTQEDLGAETKGLKYTGSGKYDGADFTFTGPINHMKFKYHLGSKYNSDMQYDALVFEEDPFIVDVSDSDLTVTGVELTAEAKTELVGLFTKRCHTFKTEIQSANKDVVKEFPMDTMVPFVFMFYATQFSENVKFEGKFIELGFSFDKLNMLLPKQKKLLKAIKGDFYKETNTESQDALAQIIIDDNFFNAASSVLVSIDKMFSSRELLKGNARAEPFLAMLTTTTVGTVLPQFTEEYGEGKKLDLVLTPSHEFFLDGIPGSKMTGIYMDKNGNWKVQLNVAAQINMENLPGMWEPVRNIYMTLVFKFKISMNDKNPLDKTVVINPKNLELSEMKIMNGEEEMSMEQMMIQSMINIQFEQLKKMFKEIPGRLNTILERSPKEFQCLGFKISDYDLAFKKSQMQVSAYYQTVEQTDDDICAKFQQNLNESPNKILDAMNGKEGSEWSRKIKEFGEVQKESFKKAMEKENEKRDKKAVGGKTEEL